MNNTYFKILIVCTLICSCFFCSIFFTYKTKIDLFNEILLQTNNKITEYGVKTVYETKDDGETSCMKLLKDMDLKEEAIITTIKNNDTYCIEFNKSDLSGYIESINNDNHNIITINMVKKDNKNGINDLINKVKSAIGNEQENTKYFQYIKAQVLDKDIDKVNKDIINILKHDKAKNIDTIKIENGYSTVAFTKQYEQIKDNGKWIDFNYAISDYAFGKYLVIGTPVIMTTY